MSEVGISFSGKDYKNRLLLLIKARWIILLGLGSYTLIALLTSWWLKEYAAIWPNLPPLVIAYGVQVVFNFCYHQYYEQLANFKWCSGTQILLDMIFILVLFHFTGGVLSWMWVIYPLLIMEASLLLERRYDCWLVAGCCTLLHTGILFLEYYRVIAPIKIPFFYTGMQHTPAYELLFGLWVAFVNAYFAFVGTSLVFSLRGQEEVAEQANSEISRVIRQASYTIRSKFVFSGTAEHPESEHDNLTRLTQKFNKMLSLLETESGQLKSAKTAMENMLKWAARLNAAHNMEESLDLISQILGQTANSRQIAIFLFDENTGCLNLKKSRGLAINRLQSKVAALDLKHHLVVRTLRDKVLYVKEDSENRVEDLVLEQVLGISPPLVMASLRSGKNFVGLIISAIGHQGGYSPQTLSLISYIADIAAVTLNNQSNLGELEESYLSTMKALSWVIEAKDPYTRGHSSRVTEYSLAICRKLGLSEKMEQVIKYASSLHDIGKVTLDRAVLNKPAKLTPEEFSQVTKHPGIGEGLISHLKFLNKAKGIVLHHHERLDGQGYPDQLKGSQIELGARIITVADAFDAMTSDRPYRPALNPEIAASELSRCTGSQFDADCVAGLIAHLKDVGLLHPEWPSPKL